MSYTCQHSRPRQMQEELQTPARGAACASQRSMHRHATCFKRAPLIFVHRPGQKPQVLRHFNFTISTIFFNLLFKDLQYFFRRAIAHTFFDNLSAQSPEAADTCKRSHMCQPAQHASSCHLAVAIVSVVVAVYSTDTDCSCHSGLDTGRLFSCVWLQSQL